MTSQQLGEMFAEMPKRFQLINTTTWPTQARELAGMGAPQSSGSLSSELELFDEIDKIQEVVSPKTVSSTILSQEQTALKHD